MDKKKHDLLKGFVLGLSSVAVVAVIVAFVVKYRQTGELSFLPLAIIAMVIAASLLVIGGAKAKSGE